MIFIKCLDLKTSRIFFVVSYLSEEEHEKLVDILLDRKIKMKASSKEEMENQNPYIQECISIYNFSGEIGEPEEVLAYLELV